jgi:hypothetical protein
MIINLNNRRFKALSNSENGEVSSDTIFHYRQPDNLVFADYMGGNIIKGNLLGKIFDDGHLDFVYHHINLEGEIMTGKCQSFAKISDSGKILLNENWQWTCKDYSKGKSILIEI